MLLFHSVFILSLSVFSCPSFFKSVEVLSILKVVDVSFFNFESTVVFIQSSFSHSMFYIPAE